jgi:Flp pilus assembly protein TadB
MNVQVVFAILTLAVATFSTLWATGGWSALQRRSIQQELDLAKELQESATRARLTAHVEEEIDIYLYRIHEQPPPSRKRPLGCFLLAFLITAAIAAVFPDANIFVILALEGILLALLLWVYAVVWWSWWIKRSRQRHDELLQAARDIADTAAAAEGHRVEPG